MLVESVILAVIVGKFKCGKLRNLEKVKLKGLWLVFVSFLLEYTLSVIIKNKILPFYPFISQNYLIFHIAIYFLLFLFLAFNLNYKSFIIVSIGVMLNFIVIIANKGYMPVSIDMAISKGFTDSINLLKEGCIAGHTILIKGQTRLWLLGDIIDIPPPYPFPQTISIGDIFISLGIFLFILYNMKSH